MEPCGTPPTIGNHVEEWPLTDTLWYLLLRTLSINFNRGSDIPIDLIL